jgi:hypothetical protein
MGNKHAVMVKRCQRGDEESNPEADATLSITAGYAASLSGTASGLIPAYHFSRSIQKFILHPNYRTGFKQAIFP